MVFLWFLITELFRIDSNLSLNLKKDMNIYGTSQDKGFDGYDSYCLKITGDNIHSLKFDTLKFINCKKKRTYKVVTIK